MYILYTQLVDWANLLTKDNIHVYTPHYMYAGKHTHLHNQASFNFIQVIASSVESKNHTICGIF